MGQEKQSQSKVIETRNIDIEAVKKLEENHNIIFKPNDGPQTDFLAASEREVLYGGSAGGGKSYAMLADPQVYGASCF